MQLQIPQSFILFIPEFVQYKLDKDGVDRPAIYFQARFGGPDAGWPEFETWPFDFHLYYEEDSNVWYVSVDEATTFTDPFDAATHGVLKYPWKTGLGRPLQPSDFTI